MNYKDKAIHYVKGTILPMQRKQFEECGCCLDETGIQNGCPQRQLKKDAFMKLVTLRVFVCPDVASGKVKDASHCECSRQSVLYVVGNLLPDKNISVEIIETVLGGAEKCRFKVTVE